MNPDSEGLLKLLIGVMVVLFVLVLFSIITGQYDYLRNDEFMQCFETEMTKSLNYKRVNSE